MRQVLSLSFIALSLTACWGPIEQTSPVPMSIVPAQSRGKDVIALCKKVGKTDSYLCNGMDALDKAPAHGDAAKH